jgi:microcystin-dependent protein
MSSPLLAELLLFAYDRPVSGWARCDGQLLPINQNQALFALLGTTYGGDGQVNFALPNLKGRVPIHFGGGFSQGTNGGANAHTVTMSEMPQHAHFFRGNTANADKDIVGAVAPPAGTLGAFNNGYRDPTNLVTLHPTTVANVGGSQAHENRQPFLAINYMIALQGIFPSRN